MFKFNKRNLAYYVSVIAVLFFLSSLTPKLKPLTLSVLRLPLSLLQFIKQEAAGIIFYHRNLVLSTTLKNDADLLRQRLKAVDEICLENKRLKQLLDFKQKSSYKVTAAKVIARSPDNWLSVILVDKGNGSGIKRGLVVISSSGLVGRVTETTQNVSKIVLINDPDLSVSAIIQRSRQEGLVSGTLGSSLVMRYLPKESDVMVNDTVVTSGLTGAYPKGIFIGVVTDTGEEFSGLSRYAIIKPAVNLSNIEEVLIITP